MSKTETNSPLGGEKDNDLIDYYSEAKRMDRRARSVMLVLGSFVALAVLFYGMYLAGKF